MRNANIERTFMAALLLLLPSASALAGEERPNEAPGYIWRNVKIGGGGFAPNLVFSRVERGLAYLRTDMGGAYRWDAATRRWIPLQDALPESGYFGIESVAPDPVDANTVYLAAGMYRRDAAAILRSRDRGDSWTIFPTSFRMGGNEDGRGLGERLAIDPNDPSVLYFGSRHDGLQRSTDSGKTWSGVRSFPIHGRGLPARGQPTNAGLSFVVFDRASGTTGARSKTILVGVADPGEQHLFRSDDAGKSWRSIAGQPRADLLPAQAAIDDRGILYVTYSNGIGPNGVTAGAVYRYDTRSGIWSDITPEKGPERAPGGYMALSLDRQHPGTLMVASMNRWEPADALWRSTDDGQSWRDLRELSRRDVATTPFLIWGDPEADFGWWMAGLAINPFDSNFVAYVTGATIYATSELNNADKAARLTWRPWVEGIEQTAVLTLTSPPSGPPLLSGFGDISGFVHEDLSVSPASLFTNPLFANTNTIDYAGRMPSVVVRSGTPPHRAKGGEPTLAYSTDYGRSWTPLHAPPLRGKNEQGIVEERRYDQTGDIAIVASADGSAFIVITPVPLITRDRGRTWSQVRGVPLWARIIADRVDPKVFYSFDFERSIVWVSTDGGDSFSALATTGLPGGIAEDRPTWREAPWPFMATPDKAGDLWFVSRGRLFHSSDAGRSFAEVRGGLDIEYLSLGKAPQGRDYPALFAVGSRAGLRAIWRSDDVGKSWIRVNDERHEYGRRFRCIAGDPRVFGRVYVGTDGRGIVYGEPAINVRSQTPGTSAAQHAR